MFSAGHYSTGKDRRFVLLENVMKNFPNMPMTLEIKENNALLIKKVRSILQYSVQVQLHFSIAIFSELRLWYAFYAFNSVAIYNKVH